MRKIKLIVFDMEGTIFKKAVENVIGVKTSPSLWAALANHLGSKALEEEHETQRKNDRGEYIGYMDWMRDIIKIHKKYGLTKDFFYKCMNSISYWNGVRETFEELNKQGFITALISGGFKEQAVKAQKDLEIDHVFAACEYLWDDKDGSIKHYNLLPCDYDGKVDFVELLTNEYKLKPENVAFVGDGFNDKQIAKKVGLSIAFNGDLRLHEHTTYSIKQEKGSEDFREILKYLK